ncbi:MAG TPA: hypothetical protein EYH01_00065 [Campylobacterales bacterium]|nr:hypothetical protein [Campylobacterales bacterium]
MKLNILSATALALTLTLTGCGSKKVVDHEKVTIEKGQIAPKIVVGSNMDLALNDQFDKAHKIEESTKKVIFVFTKATGHLVKQFFNTQSEDFMQKRDIKFIADVSPMPSLILEYAALPDLKKHKYPIMLIRDEKIAPNYKNDANSEAIMIVNLDKLKVTNVKFVSNINDFQNEIE